MSKLDDLINKLCPDGVVFKTLGEVAKIKNGSDYKHLKKGEIPVYGSGGIMTYVDTYSFNKPSVLIPRKGSLKNLFYVDTPFWNVDTIFYTDINTTIICPKYLYYYLKTQHLEELNLAGGVPSLTQGVLNKVEIPIPPLEIQNEIVRILDNFTELEEELEEELEARRKQYEYYRDSLLFENKKSEMKTLDEIGTFERGRRFVHADDRDEGIPCIHYGELYTYYGISATQVKTHINPELTTKFRYAEKNDVVIVAAGENKIDIGVGVAWLGDEKVAIHDACYIFRHKQNPKYISYLLRTYNYHLQIKKYVAEGKICAISAEGLGKAKLPFPPIEEQNRIVEILDRFEALCNDITSGLPAEIEARHKQYEFYRDKLLTFKRKSA